MTTRECRRCKKQHEVFYFLMGGGQTHLAMICGKNWRYVPFEPDLNIDTRKSKRLQQIEAEERHRELDRECDGARDRDRDRHGALVPFTAVIAMSR